ncbi:MAG TPA: DNA-3-methyladenine glycosylase I [Burkholderiales bacterium]|nr:DNA-3-methyladenine glycosylase I [Burkholderiales bacterium]
MNENKPRCKWAGPHQLYIEYHDREWGVPLHDDRRLFEMLNLEGAQAGLSWLTILKKRVGYRKAFANFDAAKIAKYTTAKQAALMKDDGIVRNRLKINAVVENAKAYLKVRREFGSFDQYIWGFTGRRTLKRAERKKAVAISTRMSKELKKRGFRFVGATICYAFMQAVGMIDDHSPRCFRAGR